MFALVHLFSCVSVTYYLTRYAVLASCAACMHVQLGLGMGAVSCTEWVGEGGGGL